MKRLLSLLFCVCFLFFAACSSDDVRKFPEKTFTEAGLSITLTEAFHQQELEGYTLCFDSKEVAVFCMEYDFSVYTQVEKMSKAEFATSLVTSNTSMQADEIEEVEGITCFEYTYHDSENNKTNAFFTCVFETENAFWLVQFACDDAIYDEYRDAFVAWSQTVTFSDIETQ